MHLAARSSASSGWVPATILAIATAIVVVGYGVSIGQVAIFGVYVAFGIALPGLLLVRFLRGRAGYIAEDVALGLCAGYAIEIATYLVARAIGTPLLFLAWPIATLVAFTAVPGLRSHWRGSGIRAPAAWSWSLAAILGIVLAYTAGIFFARHHLTGADTPHVDMAYHLALIGGAAAPRPAGHPVRHRRPARLPLVLLCRGRGDELGDRHRAHRPALPPVRCADVRGVRGPDRDGGPPADRSLVDGAAGGRRGAVRGGRRAVRVGGHAGPRQPAPVRRLDQPDDAVRAGPVRRARAAVHRCGRARPTTGRRRNGPDGPQRARRCGSGCSSRSCSSRPRARRQASCRCSSWACWPWSSAWRSAGVACIGMPPSDWG